MRTIAMALIAALTAGSALAGAASERLFARDVLDSVQVAEKITYAHNRSGAETAGVRPVEDGTIEIALSTAEDGLRQSTVQMGTVGKMREIASFPASSGNPLLPILLESSLRAMARITGGSPFYIRNRMKEALGTADQVTPVKAVIEGQEVDAEEIVVQPFLNDAKRDRMGAFADLTLRFVMAPAARGGFLLFSAETPPGADGTAAFAEHYRLEKTEIGD